MYFEFGYKYYWMAHSRLNDSLDHEHEKCSKTISNWITVFHLIKIELDCVYESFNIQIYYYKIYLAFELGKYHKCYLKWYQYRIDVIEFNNTFNWFKSFHQKNSVSIMWLENFIFLNIIKYNICAIQIEFS